MLCYCDFLLKLNVTAFFELSFYYRVQLVCPPWRIYFCIESDWHIIVLFFVVVWTFFKRIKRFNNELLWYRSASLFFLHLTKYEDLFLYIKYGISIVNDLLNRARAGGCEFSKNRGCSLSSTRQHEAHSTQHRPSKNQSIKKSSLMIDLMISHLSLFISHSFSCLNCLMCCYVIEIG